MTLNLRIPKWRISNKNVKALLFLYTKSHVTNADEVPFLDYVTPDRSWSKRADFFYRRQKVEELVLFF